MFRLATPFALIFSVFTLASCGPASEGEACAVSADCAPESICHQGTCNVGLRACVNDGECGGGEVCRHGVCKPVVDECQGTWDCASGQVCSQGQCHRPQVGNPCQRHQDCGVAMYCPSPRHECTELTAGQCWSREICAEGEDCQGIDAETGLGQCGGGACDPACSGATPHCLGDRCVACTGEAHCPDGERCVDNSCEPPASACERNQDCPGSAPVCDQGRCVACSSDRHCPDGETCQDNRCVGVPGCQGDQDCPEDQRCEAGQCVTRQQGGCAHDGECPEGQACQNGQCVPRGQQGHLPYGETAEVASQCQSGYAGLWDQQIFCSQPCGHGEDCPLGSMCTTLLRSSMSFCVPSSRAGGPFSGAEGARCQSPGACRSAICANTQQGASCQKDCRRDAHCGNIQACMATDLDGQGSIARLCGSLNGTAPNGSACAVGGDNTCRSGICDNTTHQCQPLCCSASDCPAGLACNPTIIDRAGNHIVKICGRAQGQGAGRVGAACQGDADCMSASCLNDRCSDVCCTDADCAGLRCRPYNVGNEQSPTLVNLCQ
jgi:hypothetical protein